VAGGVHIVGGAGVVLVEGHARVGVESLHPRQVGDGAGGRVREVQVDRHERIVEAEGQGRSMLTPRKEALVTARRLFASEALVREKGGPGGDDVAEVEPLATAPMNTCGRGLAPPEVRRNSTPSKTRPAAVPSGGDAEVGSVGVDAHRQVVARQHLRRVRDARRQHEGQRVAARRARRHARRHRARVVLHVVAVGDGDVVHPAVGEHVVLDQAVPGPVGVVHQDLGPGGVEQPHGELEGPAGRDGRRQRRAAAASNLKIPGRSSRTRRHR